MAAARLVAALLVVALFCAVGARAEEFHGNDYQQLPANTKLSLLWDAALKEPTPGSYPSPLKLLGLFTELMNLTFDTSYDDFMTNKLRIWPHLPTGTRQKLIHSVGAVALVQWQSLGNHNYTGMFKGADFGIIRLSSAAQIKLDPPAIAPGMGLKFLRSGMPSTNVIAMWNLLGQPEFNFFEHDFTNHVPELGTAAPLPLRLIADAFKAASDWPTLLGNSDFGSYSQEGVREANPNFPYRLIFHPTLPYHAKFAGAVPSMDVLSDVANAMKSGTVIYEIYAQASPLSPAVEKIGALKLLSDGTMSGFTDKTMFLQHVRFEADLALRPEWAAPARARVDYEKSFPQFYNTDLPWNASASLHAQA